MRKPVLNAAVVAVITACVLVGRPALAILECRFRNLDELVAAHNLLIVRVPEGPQPVPRGDGIRDYEVEVLWTLRVFGADEPAQKTKPGDGARSPDVKPRRLIVSTTRELNRSKRYLLAGKRAVRGGKPWLFFHCDPGVVEIPRQVRLSALQGKSTREKVVAILAARAAAIEHEIEALRKEKSLLEGIVPWHVTRTNVESRTASRRRTTPQETAQDTAG
jgi:hypothetical protein